MIVGFAEKIIRNQRGVIPTNTHVGHRNHPGKNIPQQRSCCYPANCLLHWSGPELFRRMIHKLKMSDQNDPSFRSFDDKRHRTPRGEMGQHGSVGEEVGCRRTADTKLEPANRCETNNEVMRV